MICYLKGEIIWLKENKIEILLSSGIWYEVWISQLTYADIIDKELKEIELFIYHNITDNSQNLYWFVSRDEKQIFEELIKISWVWWKVALLILSLWINTLSEAIINKDNKVIESVKWIGKKMAEKIILELKDKDLFTNISVLDKWKENINKIKVQDDILKNVKSTLVNMWYNSKDIDILFNELPEWLENDINKIIPWMITRLA